MNLHVRPATEARTDAWGHDELAGDLARYLRRRGRYLCFLNVQVGLCDDGLQRPSPPKYPAFPEEDQVARDEAWAEYKVACAAWKTADDEYWEKYPLPGRPDVFAFPATTRRENQVPRIYEVKVSRSDFLSDVKAEKWRRYLYAAGQVTFAVPEGLIEPTEVPTGAGLIVRCEAEWLSVKPAKRHHKGRLNFDQVRALLFACHAQFGSSVWRSGDAV